jgi:hypothetical protein
MLLDPGGFAPADPPRLRSRGPPPPSLAPPSRLSASDVSPACRSTRRTNARRVPVDDQALAPADSIPSVASRGSPLMRLSSPANALEAMTATAVRQPSPGRVKLEETLVRRCSASAGRPAASQALSTLRNHRRDLYGTQQPGHHNKSLPGQTLFCLIRRNEALRPFPQ